MRASVVVGRCTEMAPGILGAPLVCTLPHGHAGQHHDASTGAHWVINRSRTWRREIVWSNVVALAAFLLGLWVGRG